MKSKGTQVIGVWDDHDYGINDGTKHFPLKHEVREMYLDFLEEPKDSARRLDSDSPIHQDYMIRHHNGFRAHIILLDNRFEFDPATEDRLGDQQWQWLDEVLGGQEVEPDLTMIMTGVQIHHDNAILMEKYQWTSKYRLYGLINKHQKSNVVFLSGDVHLASFT